MTRKLAKQQTEQSNSQELRKRRDFASPLNFMLIMILGFFTYYANYANPNNLFWDENYYITAVEKYKKRIFFQESHPPLGKLLMLAGESLLGTNKNVVNDLEKNDFAKNVPPDYTFKGVRFFPAIFAWLNCGLVFLLLLTLTRNSSWALALSLLYAMDNALIVHSRGAMLDSIQIFGILLALVGYFKAYSNRFLKRWLIALGVGIAWATWTKLNGLIIILLLPLLLLYPSKNFMGRIKSCVPAWGIAVLSSIIFSIIVWQSHFSLGQHIEASLNNSGWYRASDTLKEIKTKPNENRNIVKNFAIEFRDYMEYIGNYSKGVPRLNLCKIGENGSPFFWWPFGGRAINYRWQSQQGDSTSYLYLVPNPVVWGLALLAVILSLAYFLMKLFTGSSAMSSADEQQLAIFTFLYICYMISIASIDRVMYSYHYFIPLMFSFFMFAKWAPFISQRIQIKNFPYVEGTLQGILMAAIALSWYNYRPFTYYLPINCKDFEAKNIFSGWQMKPVRCDDFKNKSIYQPEPPPPPPSSSSSSSKN